MLKTIFIFGTWTPSVAIKRTPHYDVWSAPPRALNIGAVQITALAPAPPHQKV